MSFLKTHKRAKSKVNMNRNKNIDPSWSEACKNGQGKCKRCRNWRHFDFRPESLRSRAGPDLIAVHLRRGNEKWTSQASRIEEGITLRPLLSQTENVENAETAGDDAGTQVRPIDGVATAAAAH
jgi:hypothetical protein